MTFTYILPAPPLKYLSEVKCVGEHADNNTHLAHESCSCGDIFITSMTSIADKSRLFDLHLEVHNEVLNS